MRPSSAPATALQGRRAPTPGAGIALGLRSHWRALGIRRSIRRVPPIPTPVADRWASSQPLLKPGAFSSGGWRRIPRGCGERPPRLVNRVRGRGYGAHGAACPRYASFPGCGQRPSVGEPVCGSGGAPGSEVEGYRRIRGAGAAVLEVRIGDGTLKRLPSAATRRTPVTSFRRAVSAARGAPWPVAAGRRRDACRMAGRLAEAT